MKILILLSLSISTISFLAFQRTSQVAMKYAHGLKSSSGPNAGFTGAPGEGNCTQCHTGAVLDGTTLNEFTVSLGGSEVTEYTPGESFDLFLNFDSGNFEKGFQITALDENNEPAGDFTAGTNTELKNGTTGQIAGRKYVTHTSGTNSVSGWNFTWNAPAEIVGEVTFYVSTNKTNNSNTSGGDQIYLAQYTLNTSAGLVEQTKLNDNFTVGYSPSNNQLVLNFETKNVGTMYLNLTDLNGKSVYHQDLGQSVEGENKQFIVIPNSISNGIYVVNFFVDNKAMSAKVQIVK